MFAALSHYMNSLKYAPLGQSPEASDANTTRLQVHTFRFFNSKRLALILVAVILILLVGLFHLYGSSLDLSGVSGGWPAGKGLTNGTDGVDWSRFAYTQYATNAPYLCNSVMLFEILHRLGSKADRLLMYPSGFKINDAGSEGESDEAALLRKARDEYNVKLSPIEVIDKSSNDPTWAESYTKLLAFNQTQYDRVLNLDSDSTVLQTMDELFLLPPVPLAIPRAYWLNFDDRVLSSQLLLIQPSKFEYARVAKAIDTAKPSDYDMEIVNDLYKDSAMILPHRPYDLLTGEFRNVGKHKDYMGSEEEEFDPDAALKEAKFLHFSDYPVQKPWLPTSPATIEKEKPKCIEDKENNKTNCRQQELWLGFYADFARRRKEVCNIEVFRSRKRGLSKRGYKSDPVFEPLFR